jgi:hypothetical protein
MRRIFAQARKELTQIARDRLALALALVLPLGLLLLLSHFAHRHRQADRRSGSR